MMRVKLFIALSVLLLPALFLSQTGGAGVDPASLVKPLSDSWPTYSGDYTGRRYSLLKQADRSTVKNLTLAWTTRLNPATGNGTIVGGEGLEEYAPGGVTEKGAVLMVDG